MKRYSFAILTWLFFCQVLLPAVLAGKIDSQFSVSELGAAQYAIPIQTQSNISNFFPEISLTYNSQAGNGIVGLGWSLGGMFPLPIIY